METHLEHEMKSCLEEMEKLQTKAKELQQKKIEQETIQQSKISETSPNMNIMKEWLDDYNEAEEYSKIVNATKNNTCQCKCNGRHGYYTVNGNCYSTSCRSKEKLKREKVQSKKFINIISNESTSYPSEFMKDFIEATYNLFQIQQKRIEELEDIVHDQIATTLKFDS
tara:strand:- start:3081 stop:3584 length:504 start_codon:yes stop_codon:yes gene_type:complete